MIDRLEPLSIRIARDGRRIGVAEVGRRDGVPLFHFHGSGSSRLEVLLLAEEARRLGVRLIGLDRPGVGLSDPTIRDGILDWPDTVAEVADRLGIARFAVEGMSGGGPYALACTVKIPERLIACGLIDALPPPDLLARAGPRSRRAMWWLARRFPRAAQLYLRFAIADCASDAETMDQRLRFWRSWASDADRALLRDPALCQTLGRVLVENVRQGAKAARRGMAIDLASWGFDVGQIGFAPIFLWHGENDRIVPVAAARLLAGTLPHCQAVFYPADGHFSVLLNHAEDIFRALAAGD